MGSIMLNGISYTSGGADVEANPQDTPSDTLSTIGIDGVVYEIEGGGGGSDVAVNPTITSGTKIADITVDGDTSSLYAPEVSLTYAEYMALTEQEKNNGTTYYITDMDAGSINIFAPVIYSQQEREIGVWIDNKPLYAKTCHAQNVTSSASVVDASFLEINYHLVGYETNRIKMGGVYNGAIFVPSSISSSATLRVYVNSEGLQCNIEGLGSGLYADDVFFTILYTKTTDTAGSGSYNTLGVPMVHYSTDEQVVGTWIDGNTIYQKSISFDNTSSANLSIDVTCLHIDKMIEMKVWNRNTGYQVNAYYNANTDYINAYFDETGYVHIRRSGTAFAGTGYITIQYTKITD